MSMTFAQQKERSYARLASTLNGISRDLAFTNAQLGVMGTQLDAMGKFAAFHAAQLMAVSRIEEADDDAQSKAANTNSNVGNT